VCLFIEPLAKKQRTISHHFDILVRCDWSTKTGKAPMQFSGIILDFEELGAVPISAGIPPDTILPMGLSRRSEPHPEAKVGLSASWEWFARRIGTFAPVRARPV
jgi:hypothetical protein